MYSVNEANSTSLSLGHFARVAIVLREKQRLLPLYDILKVSSVFSDDEIIRHMAFSPIVSSFLTSST